MNKTIEELVEEYVSTFGNPATIKGFKRIEATDFLRTALTKAYEAGQVEMGKWVLYTNTGGRAGIHSKIEAIAGTLKAKTDI